MKGTILKGTIRTEPVPQLRARFMVIDGQIVNFTPTKTMMAMGVIQLKLEKYNFTPFPQYLPLKLTLVFYRTQSVWNKKRCKDKYPSRRPDIDNFAKLFMEVGTGLLYYDDSQIVNLLAKKRWTDKKKGYITFNLKEDK